MGHDVAVSCTVGLGRETIFQVIAGDWFGQRALRKTTPVQETPDIAESVKCELKIICASLRL